MATALKMPQLGVTMTEARLVSWLKREGEPVRKGDPLATIETDKINAEVEATADGILRRIVAQEGAVVPVVGLLAVIAGPDEPDAAVEALVQGAGGPGRPGGAGAKAAPAPRPEPRATSGGRGTPDVRVETAGAPATAAEVRASPMARRVATDLGVDLIGVQGSGPGGRIVEADVRAAATAVAEPAPPAPAPVGAPGGGAAGAANGFVRASPLARRLARERGLDLGALRGTGPEGRVVERDILAAPRPAPDQPAQPTQPAQPAPGEGLTRRETVRVEGIRRLIADRMWESLQRAAQLTLTMEADATALTELRGHLVPAAKVFGHRPPTYTDLLVYLVARVLPRHPLLNSSLVGEGPDREIAVWQEVNLGVAVSLDRGLLVPVIKGADQKPLQTISHEVADMAERARAGRLGIGELEGGTFTLTNLGHVEVETFTPILNPPQAAILGVGRIMKKAVVFEDAVAVRQMVSLSLTFDHRVVDGAPAGAFLRDVKRAVEGAALEGAALEGAALEGAALEGAALEGAAPGG